MANVISEVFSYTYNGVILKEVFFKPSVATPAISDYFRIIPGAAYKIQATLSPVLEKIVKAGTNCSRTASGAVTLTSKEIPVEKLKMFVEFCAEEFETSTGNWMGEEYLKTGVDVNDISGTELERIIDRLLEDSLRRDLWRILSFGDTNDADANYNQLDGLWVRMISGSGGAVGSDAYGIKRVADLGTGSLANGEALSTLKAAYEEADAILDQIPEDQKYFLLTRSMFDNLVTSYESSSTGSDLQVTWQKDGIPQVRYRGVPVTKVSSWDVFLADPANPWYNSIEHLLLYTTRENHVVGVQNQADLNRIDGWFDKTDDKFYFDSKMRAGYNYLHDDLTVVAY